MIDAKNFQSTQAFLKECAELADIDEATKRIATWALPDDVKTKLEQKLNRLQELPFALDRPLRLAVCGENNAGKSTLINALVGEEIAVVNFMEFTFAPMVFRYGPERRAEILGGDGTTDTINIEQLEEVLTAIKERGDASDVERITVELPIEKLKKYELADVPGLGADERNANVAQSFAEKIDAVIFVLNAGLIGQSQMFEEMQEISQEFSELAIVVNKIDQIGIENTDRMLQYMGEQTTGYKASIFPMCAGEVIQQTIQSDLPQQWMEDFKSDFLARIETNAQNVQSQTALSKCQRDLASTDAMLQSAYHLATRVFDLSSSAEQVLLDEEQNVVTFIQRQISNWEEREAFVETSSMARQKLKESGSVSKAAVHAIFSDAFDDCVMNAESETFAEIVNNARSVGWQKIGAKTTERCGDKHSAFQLEKTLQLVKKERNEPHALATVAQEHLELGSEVHWMTSDIVTSDEREQEGTLSQEDVGGAGALGILAGGGTAAALATWGGATTFMTALTGVGLPLAAVTGAVALGARWLDRKKKMRPETSVAELAEIANHLRSSAAEKVVEAHFPDGVEETLTKEIRAGVEACKAKMRSLLWPECEGASDLASLKQMISSFEVEIGRASDLRRSLYGNNEDEVGRKSPASNRASVLYERSRRISVDDSERLREELGSVFCLEDAQLTIIDRRLSGHELSWLRDSLPTQAFLRAFIFDAENNAESRSEFAHSLERIRDNQEGDVIARAVKYRKDNRTPLNRVLAIGSDWVLELNSSLEQIGQREVNVKKLSEKEEKEVRANYLQKYGSIDAISKQGDVAVIDL